MDLPLRAEYGAAGISNTKNNCMNAAWSYAHLPTMTVPVVKDYNNLPFGLQIIGRLDQDGCLLALADHLMNILSKRSTKKNGLPLNAL